MKDRVKGIWNVNAEFWDSKMGEGNDFHKILLEPIQLRLLDIKAGDRILDIACGNGQFARKMAESGAIVTAIDFSDKFIEIAKSKSADNIKYQVIDVTKQTDLKKLEGDLFDSIVCTMAFMDMEDIEILIKHSPKLLKRTGKFVFSITHPCFNSGNIYLVHEQDDIGGNVNNKYGVKISDYLIEQSNLGIGIVGQPEPQYYFHRPVSAILRYFFTNGFMLDAYEEPSYGNIESDANLHKKVFQHIPPALICRLRLVESLR